MKLHLLVTVLLLVFNRGYGVDQEPTCNNVAKIDEAKYEDVLSLLQQRVARFNLERRGKLQFIRLLIIQRPMDSFKLVDHPSNNFLTPKYSFRLASRSLNSRFCCK